MWKRVPVHVALTCSRCIFTESSLGLAEFRQFRLLRKRQLRVTVEQCWTRLGHYALPHSSLIVYTEDLKNALALAETKEQLALVESMCRRYNDQSERLKFFACQFGPALMRLFHELQKPDEALQLIKDKSFRSFFDCVHCYAISMDLLFKRARYSDVLDVWQAYSGTNSFQSSPYPRSLQILVSAALYKLATPQAYEQSLSLVSDLVDRQVPIVRKALCLVAALCLQVNEAAMALELVTLLKFPEDQASSRSVLCLALARLGRLDEALERLDEIALIDVAKMPMKDRTICQEAIVEIGKVVQSEEERRMFNSTVHRLKLSNCLLPCTLDQLVCAPVYQRGPNLQEEEKEEDKSGDAVQRFLDESVLRSPTLQNDLTTIEVDKKFQELVKKRIVSAVGNRISSEGPFEA